MEMLTKASCGWNPNLTANGMKAIFPFLSQFAVRLGFSSFGQLMLPMPCCPLYLATGVGILDVWGGMG